MNLHLARSTQSAPDASPRCAAAPSAPDWAEQLNAVRARMLTGARAGPPAPAR